MSTKFREKVTEMIVAAMEEGVSPWRKGYILNTPYNPVSKRNYRGGNRLYLSLLAAKEGYTDPRWLTLRQANEKFDARVMKGEKSTSVEYWQWAKPVKRENPEAGEDETVMVKLDKPRVFYANVFNASQIEGLPEYVAPNRNVSIFNETVADILANSGAVLRHASVIPHYSMTEDEIVMPSRESFHCDANYYATLMHEFTHWTGGEQRLNRFQRETWIGSDEQRAKEELVAELGCAFMMGEIGEGAIVERHASYLSSWIEVLRGDNNAIFKASALADKAATYLMGYADLDVLKSAESESARVASADMEFSFEFDEATFSDRKTRVMRG